MTDAFMPVDADATGESLDTLADEMHRWWEPRSNPAAPGWLKAELVEIRRAPTLTAVCLCPAYQRLFRSVVEHGPGPWSDRRRDRLAAAAGLVAAVRSQPGESASIAKLAGQPAKGSTNQPVSPARMRRLIECQDIDELFGELRRVVALLDYCADVRQLSRDVLSWNDRNGRGNAVRKRWAYAYEWPA